MQDSKYELGTVEEAGLVLENGPDSVYIHRHFQSSPEEPFFNFF